MARYVISPVGRNDKNLNEMKLSSIATSFLLAMTGN